MSGEQDFWSRRKAGVQAESRAEQAELERQALAREHAALEEKTDAELLVDLELPDPDAMKMGDDFSAFMSKAVPDRLRRRALRTLWRSNPVLANVDMLVDYGEDFTDSAMVVENMQTAYQIGKGMLQHVEELASQAGEQENPPEPELEPESLDEEGVELADVETSEDSVEFVDDYPDEEISAAPTPRRMKFKIEGATA